MKEGKNKPKGLFDDSPQSVDDVIKSIHIPVTKEDVKAATTFPVFDPTAKVGVELQKCAHCKEEIFAGEQIIHGGLLFHRECTSWEQYPTDLKANPKIDVHLNLRIGEFALIAEIIEQIPELNGAYDTIANTIASHSTYWVRCIACGKVLPKAKAIFGGVKTTAVKLETHMTIATPIGRISSRVRDVEVFCSAFCDTNYASKIKLAWQKEEDEKAKAREEAKAERAADREAKGEQEKKNDPLKAALKLSKSKPELAKALTDLFAQLKADGLI